MDTPSSIVDLVWDIVRRVPPGRVTTYGAIARCIGARRSARFVGWILNQGPADPFTYPAHRVVNRLGLLTGKHHFGGENVMAQLLESEGLHILDDQVVEFERAFWDPNKELI